MKKLAKILVVFVIIGIVILSVIRIEGIFSNKTNTGMVMDKNNNQLTYDVGILHKNFNVGIWMEEGENINQGIPFEIINPKGEKVKEGILKKGEEINETFKAKKGEWKVKFEFKDDSNAMIVVSFRNNSEKENKEKFH